MSNDGTNMKRLAELRAQRRQAGTLQYEGNTALDKVYACSDLRNEAKRSAGSGVAVAEFKAVQDALFKLEKVVEKAGKK